MYAWYNIGGKIKPVLKRQTGGAVPVAPLAGTQGALVPQSAAQQPWNTYLAGTNPYHIGGGYGAGGAPTTAAPYTPPVVQAPVVPATTAGGGSTGAGDNIPSGGPLVGNIPFDAHGNPTPYQGVDQYDLEGDDNFLTQKEIAANELVIANELGADSFDASKTAESQLTPEQYAEYQSQSQSNPAQLAADNIYNNNQQIYGEETGNNVTSLVTGNASGINEASVKDKAAAALDKKGLSNSATDKLLDITRDTNRADSDDNSTTALEHSINRQAADYAASGKVFDPNDPSTWATSGELAGQKTSQGLTGKVGDLASKAVGGAIKSQLGPLGGLVPADTYSGGGADGKGSLGKVGDFFGGIGDALGITDYSGENAAAKAAEAAAKPAEAKSDVPSFFNPSCR